MFNRIVVGVAKTETARRAAAVARDLAERYSAELHLVMALDRASAPRDSPGRRAAETILASYEPTSSAGVRTHVLPGDPADVLLMVAGEVQADLIVVGNRGMRGAGRVLGSVPNSVAHAAPCSVLIVDTMS